jgi:farnesyl-diphosphate farnesyltransferase
MRTLDDPLPDSEDEQRMLKEVSRSFALTIPQLPPALRRAVTNAYLVCRIIDTIEDEESLSLDQKRFFFQEFIGVINGQASAGQFADALYPLLSGSTLPGERELIGNTPLVIRNTKTFSQKQQAAIKRCAVIMARGMQAFQESKGPQGLKNLADFNRYCYHVAGVVGEMLTDLFCEYSSEISREREKLLRLAVSFGQGLQMTNIIKDLWEDKNHGACWLPRDIFQKAGYDLKNLSSGLHTEEFGEGLSVLLGIARAHLQNALAYTLLIPAHETGIRKFCLWAIGMAILTLRKINKRRNYKSGEEVKISRRSVRAIIRVTHATLGSDFLLKRLFGLTTWGLPISALPPGDRWGSTGEAGEGNRRRV